MANGLKVDGGYRYYGFVQKRITNVYHRAVFTDGVTWKPETWKFEADTRATLIVEVKDVSVTRLSNGQYLMVYATIIPLSHPATAEAAATWHTATVRSKSPSSLRTRRFFIHSVRDKTFLPYVESPRI